MSAVDVAHRAELAKAGQKIMRAHFALKIIREFCMNGYNATVCTEMRKWIDGGMTGPVPWPKSLFFEEWAEKQGWSNIDGYVGFRLMMRIVDPTEPRLAAQPGLDDTSARGVG